MPSSSLWLRQPNNADVYYDLGITLRDQGDVDAAAAAYRKAIALNPGFWEAHNNLGMLLHDLKSFDGAIAEYLEAKRLAPQESVVRNNLGNTYCDKGDYDNAITEFRELFRHDSSWQTRSQLSGSGADVQARLRIRHRRTQTCHSCRIPMSPEEHRYLGQALLLVHRQPEAVRELRLAVQLDPDSALAHHYLATALFNAEDFAAAEAEFRQALRLQPTADNHYYLSACLMSLGRYDAALAELDTAARLQPAENLYRTRKQELLKLMKASNVR